MQLDSVQIGAADLDGAVRAYGVLLGIAPVSLPGGARRFQLERGAVEIEAGPPGLHAIRFVATEVPPLPPSFHGLDVRIAPAAAHPPTPPRGELDAVAAIDHVVVFSPDPGRAIALWRDHLGLRLALDREFPERSLRLLFFRSGGITLEYASGLAPAAAPGEPDRLHGVSYRVPDLATWRARLVQAGLDVSEIRPGLRPGTLVATVRSGTAGVPTLLIQHAPRADPG